jgi:hypothetical protein
VLGDVATRPNESCSQLSTSIYVRPCVCLSLWIRALHEYQKYGEKELLSSLSEGLAYLTVSLRLCILEVNSALFLSLSSWT